MQQTTLVRLGRIVDHVIYYSYLEEDSVGRWNGLKHVTCDEMHVTITGGCLADDVRKVQHRTLNAWKRPRYDLRGRAMAATNIDQRAQPAKDTALVHNNDLEEELAISGHGVVQEAAKRGILVRHLPLGAAVRHLEE